MPEGMRWSGTPASLGHKLYSGELKVCRWLLRGEAGWLPAWEGTAECCGAVSWPTDTRSWGERTEGKSQ